MTNMVPRGPGEAASVVAGGAMASSQGQYTPSTSGALSHLLNHAPRGPSNPSWANNPRPTDPEASMNDGTSNGTMPWRKQLPPASRQFGAYASVSPFLGVGNGPSSHSFTPSYLRNSRYLERLAEVRNAKAAALRDSIPPHNSNTSSLSTSSSSVNLHKMAPSHRGMTYDIVEKEAADDDDQIHALPSRWDEGQKSGGIEIMGDGSEVRFMGPSKPSLIAMGFSGPDVDLHRLPGWEHDSWAYHGDDGRSFCGQSTGRDYGPKFSTSDVIGCGINFRTGNAFFTKNGLCLGTAFRDIKGRYYPAVGLKKPGEHIRVNFGQTPFVFDIDGMMAKEKLSIEEEINLTDVSTLHPGDDETALIQKLVGQFLSHDGFTDTARAFSKELWERNYSLNQRQDETSDDRFDTKEDLEAVQRQRIRRAILDGDIDKAFIHTTAFYPLVLKDNEQIYFRLRCRKFIEMIRQCSDLNDVPAAVPASAVRSTNGHRSEGDNDVFEHEMDVDEQTHDDGGWEKIASRDAETEMRHLNLLQETIRYGQTLQSEYRDDERKEVKKALEQTFSLLAYEDPKSSVSAHLLEPSGRIPVAEELNSAILVSLGQSSSAALERVYQQTEVLVEDLSEEGGVGAFINVRHDFLT
ncbi:MAG: hypothetical protein M1817_000207 [Caeruleum heppii]|nr:MAG: hypothetical protein M1817_000207 [Caeruleum heppii]